MGTRGECAAAVDALRAAAGLTVCDVSPPKPNRGGGVLVRVFVDALLTAPSFTCPECGRVSYHPRDIEEGYCGACHSWTRAIIRHPLVAEARRTCVAAPEQYEGRLTDGRHFYFRLRSGRAQLGLGDDPATAATSTIGDDRVETPVDTSSGGSFDSVLQRDTVFAALLYRWLQAAGHG
ncbi:hypothetical protein AB0N38_10650 [Micromonospora aurantiaca]|uniref:hypothetical protein n=1 Tax=Micromonospora aurantiaca (nom. illeg.) TaxID=47850 RepID=UPI003416C278